MSDEQPQTALLDQQNVLAIGNADSMTIEQLKAWIGKRTEIFEVIRLSALKVTRKTDWLDQNGKPYLMAPGVEKVRGLFGVSLSSPIKEVEEGEDEQGRWWLVKYKGVASHPMLGEMPVMGTCGSRDQFFGTRNEYKGVGDQREKVKIPKTLAELNIVRGEIEKSALTNYRSNGITQLLGLRGLTWEDVKEGAGIAKEETAKVSYQAGAKGGQADASLISEPQAKRVYALASAHGIKMEEVWKHLQAQAAAYGLDMNPPTSVNDAIRRIRRADYNKLCAFLGVPNE